MSLASSKRKERDITEMLTRYRRHRRWHIRFWFTLGVALICVIVFRRPEAWGDGTVATVVRWGAWATLAVSLVATHISGTKLAEEIGFSRGKFGKPPRDLKPDMEGK